MKEIWLLIFIVASILGTIWAFTSVYRDQIAKKFHKLFSIAIAAFSLFAGLYGSAQMLDADNGLKVVLYGFGPLFVIIIMFVIAGYFFKKLRNKG